MNLLLFTMAPEFYQENNFLEIYEWLPVEIIDSLIHFFLRWFRDSVDCH